MLTTILIKVNLNYYSDDSYFTYSYVSVLNKLVLNKLVLNNISKGEGIRRRTYAGSGYLTSR